MDKNKGLIFDIQSYSVHDGPGCRTTCFFSGCFLKCEWCANPESWTKKEKIMFAEGKCKHDQGCNRCEKACEKKAISFKDDNSLNVDWKVCENCTSFECAKVCYNEALRICGKNYTVDSLLKILNRDRQFWGSNGGVTFSGGEPFYQSEFLISTLKKCKEMYINTAIETTAFVDTNTFLEGMKYVDFAFIDIKHMDREKHKEKTGAYNDLILKNIKELINSNWQGRLVVRMPVIRDFNDTVENAMATADFMNDLGIYEINLLPFHRMGDSKWTQLGKKYSYSNDEPTSEDKLDELQDIYLDRKIACYIGSETSF
ncbi:4-hydroxyphenylacetate decarboxylase activase [Clostridium botulinum]|uniref:4-hydroxyphenylacetate decarboxylase activase n=1 Tax=Clostridium botulinum TaxID=1491 RepID=UPI000376C5BB|nr:4-hydroxyphenylacetate decarboxylase activase [Clostridium botulinum]MBN1035590.1 glycyl-radical enzyme activating protein [Clostridium botulinum]MBN1058724.1 glycyl-radical enzyme activating protein [Clostridium botulinum]MBN1061894.1 glycyl-radical enzyme activating protein [Clostridium botulinum]MBY6931157.1 4-hydroxyphenylacetate decarboxylase activase [Clostridium botulinum]MCS6109789.1 glycyl-radical enzyme activating protein [Clostridium botulinum]